MNNFFDLKPYFTNSIYVLRYFDLLVSQRALVEGITKNDFLGEHSISTTSFRRCQQVEQNVAQSITNSMCELFHVKVFPKDKIKTVQKLFDEIYLNFYFKKDIDSFLPAIDSFLEEDTTLTPLFQLFKLLISLSRYALPKEALGNNMDLYMSIKANKRYYSKDFEDLLMIIELLYSTISYEEIHIVQQSDSKFSGIFYQVLCYKAYNSSQYGMAIYYGNLAKEKLIYDLNYSRVLSINLTLFSSLNAVGEFQKVYDDAPRQIDYYRFNNINDKRYYGTYNHYFVACLGLMKYDEVIQILTSNYPITIKEYIYLLYAYFQTNKQTYSALLSKLQEENIEKLDIILDSNTFYLNPKEINYRSLQKHYLNRGFMKVLLSLL